MGVNFRIFIFTFLLIISFRTFAQTEEKRVALFFINSPGKTNERMLFTRFLINKAEEAFSESSTRIVSVVKDFSDTTQSELNAYTFANSYDGYYRLELIDGEVEGVESIIRVELYNIGGDSIYEKRFYFESSLDFLESGMEELEERWLSIFRESEGLLAKKANIKLNLDTVKETKKSKYKHNFPYFNLSATAISVKLDFDERGDEFSVFPIDIRLAFFPLQYLEVGLYCRFDYDNMVYKYYDAASESYKFWDSGFNFHYGIFVGASFHYEKLHFSLGVAFYNIFYHLNSDSWKKTADINSYFLPQFAIYQRLNIKLFKFLYYSIYFNIKSMPLFHLEGGYMYSKPFSYDFITLEVSVLGFSILL